MSKHQRELSLETVCKHLWQELPGKPPVELPDIECLVSTALQSFPIPTVGLCWTLHETGMSENTIGDLLGTTRHAVRSMLSMATEIIRNEVDRECYAVFMWESEARRNEHKHVPHRPALPANLARARERLEEWGLETHVFEWLDDRCLVVGKEKEWDLTFPQVIRWARTGTAPNIR